MKRFALTLFMSLVLCLSAHQITLAADKDPEMILDELRQSVSVLLDTLDRDTAQAAETLSHSDMGETVVRSALDKLYAANRAILRCAFIDVKGITIYVEPLGYRPLEGKKIIDLEQVRSLHKTGKAFFSNAYRDDEGANVADLEYPVFRNGVLVGSVSVLVRPEILLSNAFERAAGYKRGETWAMQLDGRIVYDKDTFDIGRNLLLDPTFRQYTDLIELCKKIASERQGSGSFTIVSQDQSQRAKKSALWTNVGLHGTEWRLVITTLIKQ